MDSETLEFFQIATRKRNPTVSEFVFEISTHRRLSKLQNSNAKACLVSGLARLRSIANTLQEALVVHLLHAAQQRVQCIDLQQRKGQVLVLVMCSTVHSLQNSTCAVIYPLNTQYCICTKQ